LNRYPSLKNVFNTYINQGYYENVVVEYVSAMIPTAFFYDEHDNEIDSVVLSDLNLEGLKDLLASRGFELRRPSLPEPILSAEKTLGEIHYQFFGDGKLYHSNAQDFASSLNYNGMKGRLLTFLCKEQEEKISEWMNGINPQALVWLGASDSESEGYWKWTSNGELFWSQSNLNQDTASTFTNWRDGEPNNAGGNEHCATYKPNAGWNDVNCDSAAQIVVEFGISPSKFCDEPVLTSVLKDSQDVNL